MTTELTGDEYAALEVLRGMGGDILELALVAREAMQAGRGNEKRTRKILELGTERLKQESRTVNFSAAVEAALESRRAKGLRPRSIVDFRYICKRLLKRNPGLEKRRVRSITSEDCAQYLAAAFDTPQQYKKARAILSGVFSTAVKRGWCDSNPVARVEVPVVREKAVQVLAPQEIDRLLETAQEHENGACLSAVGMMLYAGIRPQEVQRLTWGQVDLEHGSICILPQHSKTGGARRVTINPPLARLLGDAGQHAAHEPVCPPNWLCKWRTLRRAAGWDSASRRWTQDALRHTFASYHLGHFHDYTALQWEMGYRSSALLRTRYVDLRGVVDPQAFWE
ncbi:MAG: tyrosine-type recombinase/integrase [Akkermansia sp.]|nr:tyrosine-type recombinase/integrase [Akkermansia sp.]